jgi:regulatory protein
LIDVVEFLKNQNKNTDLNEEDKTDEMQSILAGKDKLLITDIKAQKKKKDRYSIFINGKFLMGVYDDLLLEYGLAKGSLLTYEVINEILYEDLKKKAIRASLSLLSYKQRTAFELRKKLKDKEYDEEIIDIAIARLIELGYVNDERYARDFVDMRKSYSGLYKLKTDLYKRGINNDIIELVLSEIDADDQYEELKAMCKKKLNQSEGLEVSKKYNRIMSYLLRKGYNFSDVKRVMSDLDIKRY